MVTNEKRLDVAARLRRYSQDPAACNDFDRYLRICTRCISRSVPGMMNHLADLIEPEPEPERTCRMTKIGGDRVLAGWWECSKCGPVYPPCKDEIAEWALRKCPHCGAKVVDDAD